MSEEKLQGLHKDEYGNKCWYKNGELHKEDGPAFIFFDSHRKEWYINGKRHRLDGPAIEYSDGKTEYWLEGKQVEESDLPG